MPKASGKKNVAKASKIDIFELTVKLRQLRARTLMKNDFLMRVPDGVRVPDGCAFFKQILFFDSKRFCESSIILL